MKNVLYVASFLILLLVTFVGGFRYNQYSNNLDSGETGNRKILHYVDPMNPANTSKEPGIAPCGMPMEPVYADDRDGGSTAGLPIGSVRISSQKEQIIGVQTSEVALDTASARFRVLGRIVPDENKVYSLVSGTDGWMGEIHDSTTGSLVKKDQLMGKIRMYDYDFYTWQQRYLTELGNAGRRRVYVSPLSGVAQQVERNTEARRQAGELLPDAGAPIMLPSDRRGQSENEMHDHEMEMQPPPVSPGVQPQTESAQPAPPHTWGIPPGTLYYGDGSQPAGDLAQMEAQVLKDAEKMPEFPQEVVAKRIRSDYIASVGLTFGYTACRGNHSDIATFRVFSCPLFIHQSNG